MSHVELIEYLKDVEPENIPALVSFPIQKILDRNPVRWFTNMRGERSWDGRGLIWDMGYGGAKSYKVLYDAGFTVGGYEINQNAVDKAKIGREFFGRQADIRLVGSGDYGVGDAITYMEMVDNLLYQAVFPSMLGDDWKNALDAMDMLLMPGGHVFIADFLLADLVYPELVSGVLTQEVWEQSARRWRERYQLNQDAFSDLGIGETAFAVGLMGIHKLNYDWVQKSEVLRAALELDDTLQPKVFERFARHIDRQDFVKYITGNLGYIMEEEVFVPRYSRSGLVEGSWNVVPGVEWIFRKPSKYKYRPWQQGDDVDDPERYVKMKDRRGSPNRSDYWDDYFTTLLKTIPVSQQVVYMEIARRIGVRV